MKAERLLYEKHMLDDGSIIEVKIWLLPDRSTERPHGLKYSLFYGRPGVRLIGYDNEAGKGDHKHVGENETSYVFTTLEQLIADFEADVARMRQEAKR